MAILHDLLRSKANSNLSKSGQAQPSGDQGEQRKKPGFSWIVFAELSFFQGLQRPLAGMSFVFSFCRGRLQRCRTRFIHRPDEAIAYSDFRKENSPKSTERSVFPDRSRRPAADRRISGAALPSATAHAQAAHFPATAGGCAKQSIDPGSVARAAGDVAHIVGAIAHAQAGHFPAAIRGCANQSNAPGGVARAAGVVRRGIFLSYLPARSAAGATETAIATKDARARLNMAVFIVMPLRIDSHE